jgi:hypothetical protein
MRNVTLIVLAAALWAAPAAAQNETAPETNVDANAANMVLPVDNAVVPTNDVAAVPPPAPVTTETTTETAPVRRTRGDGFPWGIIGLVGLVGLLGRRRRD